MPDRHGRAPAEEVMDGFGLVVSAKEVEQVAHFIWILVTYPEKISLLMMVGDHVLVREGSAITKRGETE